MAQGHVDVCRGIPLMPMKMPMVGVPPEARLISVGDGELVPPVSGSHTVAPTGWWENENSPCPSKAHSKT